MKKVIQGQFVSSQKIEKAQLIFDEKTGLIEEYGDLGIKENKVDFKYSDDCLIFAGMGDVHIHAREDCSGENNYKETFETASDAAINGGVVHISDMPNNPKAPVDEESYLDKLELIKQIELPVLLYCGIGPESTPISQKVPYKVFMGPSIGDLFFKCNNTLENTLKNYDGESVSFHCEDSDILEKHKDEKDHFKRRPVKAEVVAIEKAIGLIEKYHLQGKICHCSTREGLEIISCAKKRGVNVVVEVTPWHLFFCQEEMDVKMDKLLQLNPPIRDKKNRDYLLQALRDDHIDFLATDHAPHLFEEKINGISGLPGLDTYSCFVSWLIAEKKVDPKIIAKITTENPGQFFNNYIPSFKPLYAALGRGFGQFEKGYSASFTIINLNKMWTIEKSSLHSKCNWSPFENHKFPGNLEEIFLKGQKKK